MSNYWHQDLFNYEIDVLEAVIRLERSKTWELEDASGYGSVARAGARLKRSGLIEKVAGHLQPTEKGKIVFAILSGKRVRARATKGAI